MTRIKLCGMTRTEDILAVNELRPDYIGFVFYPRSKRFVSPEQAAELKALLDPSVQAVGVFVDEPPETVAELLEEGIIDIAQLHGQEDEAYRNALRKFTDKPLIQAFRIRKSEDCRAAEDCSAECILLDAGMGSGETFDWSAVEGVNRPYFLAGGLHAGNVAAAIRALHPFAVDVSSGIETDGVKDYDKMKAFVNAVREEETQ